MDKKMCLEDLEYLKKRVKKDKFEGIFIYRGEMNGKENARVFP